MLVWLLTVLTGVAVAASGQRVLLRMPGAPPTPTSVRMDGTEAPLRIAPAKLGLTAAVVVLGESRLRLVVWPEQEAEWLPVWAGVEKDKWVESEWDVPAAQEGFELREAEVAGKTWPVLALAPGFRAPPAAALARFLDLVEEASGEQAGAGQLLALRQGLELYPNYVPAVEAGARRRRGWRTMARRRRCWRDWRDPGPGIVRFCGGARRRAGRGGRRTRRPCCGGLWKRCRRTPSCWSGWLG